MPSTLAPLYYASIAKRADVILRAFYPFMDTRLFETTECEYIIYCDQNLLNIEEIRQKLHTQAPAHISIDASDKIPDEYLREIETINDHEIANNFEGCIFSVSELAGVLYSKYPNMPNIIDISGVMPITFYVSDDFNLEHRRQVTDFMNSYLPTISINFQTRSSAPPSDRTAIDDLGTRSIEIKSSRFRNSVPHFVRFDEHFWFENVESIFGGEFTRNRFTFLENSGYSCYIDASGGSHIDLRHAILLYDTIYLSPPIMEEGGPIPNFWKGQHISEADTLRLIESDRIRLVLKQPEERTNSAFLNAAFERNPNGVIGRLKAAAIFATDIIETESEYTFTRRDILPYISEIARDLSENFDIDPLTITEIFLWPLRAKRSCLRPLMLRGLMGISSFGQGEIIAKEIRSLTGKDLDLESFIISDDVHVAHSLNATLIAPPGESEGWLSARRVIGDRLNFYRSFNSRIAAAWAENERRKEEEIGVMPPISLFDFDARARIDDLIKFTSLGSTRRKGRSLVSRIANLPYEERKAEIERISQELYDATGKREIRSFRFDVGSSILDVVSPLLDLASMPVIPIYKLFKVALDHARRNRKFDNFVDIIESDLAKRVGINEDLDFLSKISRIAQISARETR